LLAIRSAEPDKFHSRLPAVAARAVLGGFDRDQLVEEISAQVRTVQSTGLQVTHLDTHVTRELGRVPGRAASVLALNADETLLAGSLVDDAAGPEPASLSTLQRNAGDSKGVWMQKRFQSRIPMQLFTLDIQTGKVKTFHPSTDWLNHVQMSPTDPTQLMFCHEGPWHLLDRTWLIRTDGSGLRQVHPASAEWGQK